MRVLPVEPRPDSSVLPAVPAIPDYELLRRIGAGAYGEVWLARSLATGALRAAKVVTRSTFQEDRPFQREFEGIKRFEEISRSHPSQLALFHIGRSNAQGHFYYVMELADPQPGPRGREEKEERIVRLSPGPTRRSEAELELPQFETYTPHTLRSDLEEGRLPASRVLELALALTEAVANLHGHGLVHRDIKPSNIIFVNGRPKLADVGLVTGAGGEGSIVGTEGYLPPEGPGTAQADLYSLGKVLYEAFTGQDRRRFPELPDDLRRWPDAELAFELNAVVVKACATDLNQRYADAAAMLAELKSLTTGASIRRQRAWRRALGFCTRWAAAMSVGLLAAALIFGMGRGRGYEEELRSTNPEVNRLVDQAALHLLSETPERIRLALKLYQEAARLDPQFLTAHYGVFNAQMFLDDVAGIRRTADTLLKLAPHSAESHLASEFILWSDWRFREALEGAHQTITRTAYSKQARSRRHLAYGFMLLQTGDPDAALEQYRLAEKIAPADTVIRHHMGHPYFVKRDFGQALNCYQQSIDLEPNHGLGHHWKGRTLEEMGDYQRALDAFEEYDRRNGALNAQRRAFYDTLREAARTSGAEGYWRKRLELALQTPSPRLYEVATLYARLGDEARAYEYLEQAVEKRAFSQGLLFDLCWDHRDPHFQSVVRRMGLPFTFPGNDK